MAGCVKYIIAQNRIPNNRGQISGLGQKMKAGLTALGVTLGITQITAASFGTLLAAFNSAYECITPHAVVGG